MVKSISTYQGELHCELLHVNSGSKIETDAPKDNKGRGERFSPSDLIGAALGSCILTTMAMTAEQHGLDMRNSKIEVTKVMAPNPRRISELHLEIQLPKNIPTEHRAKLEEIIHACPVHRSLSPNIHFKHTISYNL